MKALTPEFKVITINDKGVEKQFAVRHMSSITTLLVFLPKLLKVVGNNKTKNLINQILQTGAEKLPEDPTSEEDKTLIT